MEQKDLNNVLEQHRKWLAREGGRKADLRWADLSGADLRWADLSGADLSRANLRWADLSGADLRWADLSKATGLLSPVEFIIERFEKTDAGIVVYKTFNEIYAAPNDWKIEPDSIITECVNFDRCTDCGSGINVAPVDWIYENHPVGRVWKCLIEWSWLSGVCVPYNTDGKIRCSRLRLIEPVE